MKQKLLMGILGVLLVIGGIAIGIQIYSSAKPVISEEPPVTGDGITIMCYGDSNTYGYNPEGGRYNKEERWPDILQSLLGSNYHVIPEGLNGRTTAFDPVNTFAWKNGAAHLDPILATNKPLDYIVFMLGTNDCKYTDDLSLEEITGGMEKLIEQCEYLCPILQDSMPKIILVSPPKIGDNVESTNAADEFDATSIEKSVQLGVEYEKLAKKHNCIFVSITDIAEVSEIDGVHLTRNGQKTVAEEIYKVISGE